MSLLPPGYLRRLYRPFIAAMEPALTQVGLRLLVACLPADPAGAATRITDLARYGVGAVALFPARALPLPGISCPVVMVGKAGVGVPAECSPTAVCYPPGAEEFAR